MATPFQSDGLVRSHDVRGDVKYKATAAHKSGEIAQLAGVAAIVLGLKPIEIGDDFAAATKGVIEIRKLGTDVVTDGAVINWNNTTKQGQLAAGDFVLGKSVGAFGNGVTQMLVNLNG